MKSAAGGPYGTDNLSELLALRAILRLSTVKTLRGSSRIIPQITVAITLLLFGAYLWSSQSVGRTTNLSYTKGSKWNLDESQGIDSSGGLRIVVFGGGDIATPSQASWRLEGPNAAWTDILCLQLGCNMYLSFIPLADNDTGAIVSNSLFEAGVTRTSSPDNTIFGPDNSWLAENYPVLPHKDLVHQIQDFLASPRPQRTPRETLWIFSVGFWDIWHLAALPRKLATHIIKTQAHEVFSHIELLYEESHKNNSVAFSDCYAGANSTTAHTTARIPRARAPFRIFIPRPFDISLTPGFENSRSVPQPPHNRAERMRNAAFLTNHWDKVFQDMLDEWVRLPVQEEKEDENNLSSIQDTDPLLTKGSLDTKRPSMQAARREAVTYDISGYVRELVIERQLRNAGITDHNGLGSKATASGYSEWDPCVRRRNVSNDINNGTKSGAGDDSAWSVCDSPDEHLFWTDFTVSRRAVFEVGKRAAELFKSHVRMDTEWAKKAQQSLPSMRGGSDRALLRAKARGNVAPSAVAGN